MEILTVRWRTTFVNKVFDDSRERKCVCVFMKMKENKERKEEKERKGKERKGVGWGSSRLFSRRYTVSPLVRR